MRGQAALEYLITYGWAFIAILVVVGSLAYFGMLNPTRYLPARCDFGAQLECIDYELSGEFSSGGTTYNGLIRLQFRNNFGEDVEVTNIRTPFGSQGEWRFFNQQSSAWETASAVSVAAGNVSPLFQYRVERDDDLHMVNGDRHMATLIVTFRRASPQGPPHNITGRIFSTAKEATVVS